MIKQFKIAGLRYITIFMTAEICYFSTHIIPPVTIVTEHKTQFSTHFSKKKKKIDYFKGLLMTHHLDIFMSGKKIGIKRVKLKEHLRNISFKNFPLTSRKLDIFYVPRTNTEYLENVLVTKFCQLGSGFND